MEMFRVLMMALACGNCAMMSKDQLAMFRVHSDACMPSSGVTEQQLQALYAGHLQDSPELRQHVYCVLQRCKIIGKDGKLIKSALLGKMKNASKILEICGSKTGDSPADTAWELVRCGWDMKLALHHKMPTDPADVDNMA